MAITVVNHSNMVEDTSGTSASVTTDIPWASSAGNLLIAVGGNEGASAEGTPAYADGGTDTFTLSGSQFSGSSDGVSIGYAKSIAGKASQSVTHTVNVTNGFPSACLIEVSGCDTSAPNDVTFQGASAGTVSSLNTPLVTPAAGDHIIVVVGEGGNGTSAQSVTNLGTGAATWTVIKNDGSSGSPTLLAYAVVTANGTNTYGVTYNRAGGTGTTSVGITGFKAAAGGGATPVAPEMRTLRGAGV